jgi:hypothetical protein
MQPIKNNNPKELVPGITGYYAHGDRMTFGYVELKNREQCSYASAFTRTDHLYHRRGIRYGDRRAILFIESWDGPCHSIQYTPFSHCKNSL